MTREAGLSAGKWLLDRHAQLTGPGRLSPAEFADLVASVKNGLGGDCSVIEATDEKVVLADERCALADPAPSEDSLCNVATAVFGGIAARAFGYAKVVLGQSLALGDAGCTLTIYLKDSETARSEEGLAFRHDDLVVEERMFHLRTIGPGMRYSAEDLRLLRDHVAEALDLGLIIKDRATTWVNPLAAQWLETSEELRSAIDEMTESLTSDVARQVGTLVPTRSGAEAHTLEVSCVRSDLAGPQRLIFMLRDVTPHRLAQEQLVRAERLRALSELAASAAHELRNPIATVKGFLQLSEQRPDFDLAKVRPLMLSELERAESVLADYVLLGKAPALVLEDVPLESVLRRARLFTEARCLLSNIRLIMHHGDLVARTNEGLILEALLNLMENAIEAMPGGGTLTVRAEARGTDVLMHVEDTGRGISSDASGKLFDPFFTTKPKGTGLGLYACRSTIERLSGTLSYTSRPGRGTVFTITLPCASHPKPPPGR